VHDVRFRKKYLRGRDEPTFIQSSVEGIFEQRIEGNLSGIYSVVAEGSIVVVVVQGPEPSPA
jgi:hypothetical protein